MNGHIKYRGHGLKQFTDPYLDDKSMVFSFGQMISNVLYGVKLKADGTDWTRVLPKWLQQSVDHNPLHRPYLEEFGESLKAQWAPLMSQTVAMHTTVRIVTVREFEELREREEEMDRLQNAVADPDAFVYEDVAQGTLHAV